MNIETGTTKYVWVDYDEYMEQKSLQIIEWPNGEGIEVIRNDDTNFNLTFAELEALTKGASKL